MPVCHLYHYLVPSMPMMVVHAGARQSLVSKSQAARDAAKALARQSGAAAGKPVYVLDR